MRVFFALLLLCGTAEARTHHYHHHYRHHHSYARGNLDGLCAQAARMGGPCGCFASEHVFGHSVRELWLAANWLRFPRTTAHRGAAAVWPNRHHVAIVVADNGSTVTVHDSWATHEVSKRGLTFVEPR